MVYRHLKPQIPSLRCGMTNKKEAKLYTNGHSARKPRFFSIKLIIKK
jgi:hypothetical protein